MADRGPTFPPTLPEVKGRDDRKAAFFKEAAAGFEFLAFWHSLDAQAQEALRQATHTAAAASGLPPSKERR